MPKGQAVIDFHTHIFPDGLAPRVLDGISSKVNISPSSDETLAGLLKNMSDWGIEISVIQPVVTKQSHFIGVNEWVRSVCSERIIAFGGIYPHTENYKRDIDYVVSLGLRGLKFHPEYQDFTVDSPRMLRIYDYAADKGLIMLFHGGEDPSLSPPYKSSPARYARIAQELRGGKIVVAHLGGYNQWDDVERYLAGQNVWLDTSMGFDYFSPEQFMRILKTHGPDRILFASDSPWSCAEKELNSLSALPLKEGVFEKIVFENARTLLGI